MLDLGKLRMQVILRIITKIEREHLMFKPIDLKNEMRKIFKKARKQKNIEQIDIQEEQNEMKEIILCISNSTGYKY